jgi:hypothetical protein
MISCEPTCQQQKHFLSLVVIVVITVSSLVRIFVSFLVLLVLVSICRLYFLSRFLVYKCPTFCLSGIYDRYRNWWR